MNRTLLITLVVLASAGFFLMAHPVFAAPAVNAATTSFTNSSIENDITLNVTSTGVNSLLLLGIMQVNVNQTDDILQVYASSSVSSTTMTRYSTHTYSTDNYRSYFYYLVNPPTATTTVKVISAVSTKSYQMSLASLTGVNTATPLLASTTAFCITCANVSTTYSPLGDNSIMVAFGYTTRNQIVGLANSITFATTTNGIDGLGIGMANGTSTGAVGNIFTVGLHEGHNDAAGHMGFEAVEVAASTAAAATPTRRRSTILIPD